MMASCEVRRWAMAIAVVSLFVPESLAPNRVPLFREGLDEMQTFLERILDSQRLAQTPTRG
jgi:hypothetical protein